MQKQIFTNIGKNGEMTTEYFICSEHFGDSYFVYHINDKNNRRKWKLQKKKLKYRHVKKGRYPTKFPNCPSYLSKTKLAERPSLGSSDAREKISAQRLECKRLSELEAKTVRSTNDICSFLNESYFLELSALHCKLEIARITFYEIGYDTFSTKPFLKYRLVSFDDLNLKIWYGDESMLPKTVAKIEIGRKISLFDQIIAILECLKALCSHPHLDILEEVNVCAQKLKNVEDNVNLNICSKLQFMVEQFQLVFTNTKHRRYSPPIYYPSVFYVKYIAEFV